MGALERQVGEVVIRRVEILRHGEGGQFYLPEGDLDIAALGHLQRVVARLRQLREQRPHLRRRLEVVVVTLEAQPVGTVADGAGLHAEQRVVGEGVGPVRVVAVVGGEQRQIQPLCDVQQLRQDSPLIANAVVLQFHEYVPRPEDVAQAPGMGQRLVEVVAQQRLAHVAAETAGGGNQPGGVLGEYLPVHLGLVVVTLEEGAAGDLDEVPVAGLVLRQQHQVVVELVPGGGLTAAVVHAPAPGGPLTPVVVRQVGLDTQDGLDSLGTAGLVEGHDAVHVAVVGDAQSLLAVGRGRRHQLSDARSAVEHRVLGMNVQVGEGSAHAAVPCSFPALPAFPTLSIPPCV